MKHPTITAQVRADGTGLVTIDGTTHKITATDTNHARARIIETVVSHAVEVGAALPVTTSDPDGRSWRLLINPDGTVTPAEPQKTEPAPEANQDPPADSTDPSANSSPDEEPSEHPESHPTVLQDHEQPPAAPETTSQPQPSTATPPQPGAPSPGARPHPEPSSPRTPAESDRVWREAIVEHNLALPRRVAMISLKGGVGKTTTGLGLGSALARQHSERVIAVDANHYGTLADRMASRVQRTLADLANDHDDVDNFVTLRRYLGSSPTRLHALAGGGNGVADYTTAAALVERYFDTVVTDCRTDLDDPIVKAALDRSTHCVIVLEPATDALGAAQSTLQWLTSSYPALARNCVMAICRRTPKAPRSTHIEHQVSQHGRPVVTIPFDRHLHQGGIVNDRQLRRATRSAYERLATALT